MSILQTNEIGFESGKGTLDNPIVIDEIVVTPKKKTNVLDSIISITDSLSNLVGKITGNSGVKTDSATTVNGWLTKATAGSREFSLSKTSIGIILIGFAGLIYFFNKTK